MILGDIGSALSGVGGLASGISSIFGGSGFDYDAFDYQYQKGIDQWLFQQTLGTMYNKINSRNLSDIQVKQAYDLERQKFMAMREGLMSAGFNPASGLQGNGSSPTATMGQTPVTAIPSSPNTTKQMKWQQVSQGLEQAANALMRGEQMNSIIQDNRAKRLQNDRMEVENKYLKEFLYNRNLGQKTDIARTLEETNNLHQNTLYLRAMQEGVDISNADASIKLAYANEREFMAIQKLTSEVNLNVELRKATSEQKAMYHAMGVKAMAEARQVTELTPYLKSYYSGMVQQCLANAHLSNAMKHIYESQFNAIESESDFRAYMAHIRLQVPEWTYLTGIYADEIGKATDKVCNIANSVSNFMPNKVISSGTMNSTVNSTSNSTVNSIGQSTIMSGHIQNGHVPVVGFGVY